LLCQWWSTGIETVVVYAERFPKVGGNLFLRRPKSLPVLKNAYRKMSRVKRTVSAVHSAARARCVWCSDVMSRRRVFTCFGVVVADEFRPQNHSRNLLT